MNSHKCPFLGAQNSACVVLRFDHENPELGDDNVVDLGGSHAIGSRQINVAQRAVMFWIELCATHAVHDAFTSPTLGNGTTHALHEKT